jgi:type IV pilus assembly protein PilB
MGRSAGREKIGELLVGLGVITRAQLDEALATQSDERLGKCLVRLGHVSESKLIQTLSHQLSVPWVSLERVAFSAALLARLPAALADRYLVMPVYFRSGKGLPETLYVAMDDPTDEVAIAEIARAAKMRVRPMIAAPTDLRRAIEERYFGASTGEFDVRAMSLPTEPRGDGLRTEAPRKRTREHAQRPPARVPPPPPAKPLLKTEGAVPVDKYATPSSPPEAAPRTLTFLDGTQLRLPSAGKRPPGQLPATRVRHVVKAVTAVTSGGAAPDSLKWDEVLEAVLDALKARGVTLTRGEIGEAWARVRERQQTRNDTALTDDPARRPATR